MKTTTLWSALATLLAVACSGGDENGDAAVAPDAAGTGTADAVPDRAAGPDLLGHVDVALTDTHAAGGIDMAVALDLPAGLDAGGVDTTSAIDGGGVVDLGSGGDVVIDVGGVVAPICHTFRSADGSQLYLDNLQMISPSLGYGVEAQNGGLFDLHRTNDGGRTWTKLPTMDSGNRGSGASWAIGFYADELWLSTSFSGVGIDGTLLRSTDGLAWARMEPGIRALWSNLAEPIGTIGKVLSTGELFVVAGDGGKGLAVTADQGATWRRVDLPVQSAHVAATQTHLFMRANTSSSSNDWSLYRVVADDLQELKGNLPADFWLTRWVVAAHDDVLTLVDDEASTTSGRALLASSDGGKTFVALMQHGPSGDADGYLLRRGLSVGTTTFASLGRSGVRVRIVRSRDGGATWTTLLEESTSTDHYYWFQTDYQGNPYAIRNSYYSTAICPLDR